MHGKVRDAGRMGRSTTIMDIGPSTTLAAAVDAKIAALGKVLGAQEQLKKSLMHDLLTGRVRVAA